MNKIFSFFSKREESKQNPATTVTKTKVVNNSSNAEFEKITKYNYHSKFTSISEKVHDKLNQKSERKLSGNGKNEDYEEIEMLDSSREKNERASNLDLTHFEIFLLAFICFCVEFGYSLEIVFITPHFMILDLPPFLDTAIWLFPPFLVVIIYPCFQILIEPAKYLSFFQKKMVLVALILISELGLYFMATCENLAIKLSLFHNYSQINYYSIVFSILGFLLIDIANELINYIVGYHISCLTEQKKTIAENYTCYGGSFGKISGFFVSSFLAFNIHLETIKRYRNFVNYAFTVGLFIQGICFLLFCFFFPSKSQPERHDTTYNISVKSFISELKKLSLNSFLPGITLIKKIPPQMKIILLMHFFASCNILMITVYASSWVGVSILKIDPENTILSRRRKIFDLGISWGSVALMFSALTAFMTEIFITKLSKYLSNKRLFIITQGISSITLLILYNSEDFYSVFLILPICGVAFGTFNTVPELIADEIEVQFWREFQNGVLKQMLKMSLFFAEVTMFFVIPVLFLFTPEVNEILVSLIIAGVSGLFAMILCFFL